MLQLRPNCECCDRDLPPLPGRCSGEALSGYSKGVHHEADSLV
jgi:hypothetical protein